MSVRSREERALLSSLSRQDKTWTGVVKTNLKNHVHKISPAPPPPHCVYRKLKKILRKKNKLVDLSSTMSLREQGACTSVSPPRDCHGDQSEAAGRPSSVMS